MTYFTKITAAFFFTMSMCIVAVSAQSISASTTISISIKGVPAGEQGAIDGQYVVSDSGYVYLPLLKNGIKSSGLTSSLLSRKIEEAYRTAEIYKNPRITVISSKDQAAQSIDAQMIHVGGFVGGPGPKPYTRGMTLFKALTSAGGASPFGSMKRVELHRNGKKYVYDLNNPKHMRVAVYPGDSINVPQKTVFGN